ncbi:unnamed protein product [Periconia digitata]|uniref:DUF962-domain-containing protein n=1 Tax=Periconia digitata TaxID=1303443 RepID=A0A9W4U5H0_9PLEO|nr:unnamed protein product [Periconia digitata]
MLGLEQLLRRSEYLLQPSHQITTATRSFLLACTCYSSFRHLDTIWYLLYFEIRLKMPLFDLKKNLIFYGAYHREPTNVAIHIACVPLLLGTGFVLGTNTPSLRTPALLSKVGLPLNLATLASMTYTSLYLALSPNAAGAAVAPVILSAATLANRLPTLFSRTKINAVAGAVHVVSWILQFVGHGKFEGRKPALMDNLVQALFLAPLFVWYEVLFKLGFYKDLQREVHVGIEEEVKKLEKGKGKGQ